MSVKASTAVWYESESEGIDRLVLLAIADRAGDEGDNAWPTMAELAVKCRVSIATVRRSTRALMELGELEVEKNAGGTLTHRGDRRPNLYTIILPSLRGVILQPRDDDGVSNPPDGVSNEATRGVTVTPNSEHIHPSYTSIKQDSKNSKFKDPYEQQAAASRIMQQRGTEQIEEMQEVVPFAAKPDFEDLRNQLHHSESQTG